MITLIKKKTDIHQKINSLIFMGVGLLWASTAVAQVNIETFVSKKPIKNQTIDAAYTIQSGVTEAQSIKVNYRFDSKDPFWRWITVTEWSQDIYSNSNGNNQGLLHLRSMIRTAKNTEWEQFTQQQWDGLQQLSSRFLVGSGLRWTLEQPSSAWAIGTGAMVESELYQDGITAQKIRSTSYFNISIPFENMTLSTTTYFQPTLDHWEDYRILNRNALSYYFSPDFFIKWTANLDYKGVLISKTDAHWSTKTVLTVGVQF